MLIKIILEMIPQYYPLGAKYLKFKYSEIIPYYIKCYFKKCLMMNNISLTVNL